MLHYPIESMLHEYEILHWWEILLYSYNITMSLEKNNSVRRASADGWQLFDFYSNQVGSRAQTPINAECQYAHNQINSLDWQS